MYWNPNKTLSYNKLFNFIVGSRGGGKSFGAKDLCIRRFLKKPITICLYEEIRE